MLRLLDRYREQSYALMRIASGFMFGFHGVQKILGLFSDGRVAFGTQMWFGGMIELLGGLAIMLGYMTRPAAFLASGEMAVAYIQFHWKGQLGDQIFPGVNHGEMALLYSFMFLYVAARGAGIWAVGKND